MMNRLDKLYTDYFHGATGSAVPLTGSASNRQYFRLSSESGSCIGVIGTDRQENDAFVTLARHFRAKGIAVPEILAVSPDGMCYLQEDLGGLHLYDMIVSSAGKDDKCLETLLCRTMAALPKIQFEGAEGLDFTICYPQPSFDRRMVMFDLNYFKYCFLKAAGLEFNEIRLQDDFERFADDLLAEEHGVSTFMYRDLQSRNVMVRDGEPYFIDFQGGRRGPIYYDVASFVWHARSGFPDALKAKLVDSYLEALSEYVEVDSAGFMVSLKKFVLFRSLQVLGAYGFRGWTEHKANFVVNIPKAVEGLRELLQDQDLTDAYPYLSAVLGQMSELPRLAKPAGEPGRLTVTVTSFSFKKGIPEDPSGNGGGYVFDCRSIHNPGRYEPYKKLTGMDEPVIRFLEDDGEIISYLDHVYGVVDPHVETYLRRGFTSLTVNFGCTGGQHRSVYCAEHLAAHLAAKYPDICVHLLHREQSVEYWANFSGVSGCMCEILKDSDL